jgi:hypothetical protein
MMSNEWFDFFAPGAASETAAAFQLSCPDGGCHKLLLRDFTANIGDGNQLNPRFFNVDTRFVGPMFSQVRIRRRFLPIAWGFEIYSSLRDWSIRGREALMGVALRDVPTRQTVLRKLDLPFTTFTITITRLRSPRFRISQSHSRSHLQLKRRRFIFHCKTPGLFNCSVSGKTKTLSASHV